MEREVEKIKNAAMFDLMGATALITGGASGLGKATAKRMLRSNANVVIADYSDAGAEVARELNERFDMECRFIKTDVSKEEDVKAAVEYAVKEFGELNILVCSAGIGGANNAIADETLANWEKVNAVDYTGVMLANKYAIMQFRKQGRRRDLQPGFHVRPGGCSHKRSLQRCQGRRRQPDQVRRHHVCLGADPCQLRLPRRHQYPSGTGRPEAGLQKSAPHAQDRRGFRDCIHHHLPLL